MNKIVWASTLLLCAQGALVAQSQTAESHDFSVTSSIVYTQGTTGPLMADAVIPSGSGPFPAILYIHGGAWLNGDRKQMVKLMDELAKHGYAGFAIDYDVFPVHFPVALDESLAALAYMRSHAKELHLDPTRIAVAGSSAGGELAALVALTPKAHAKQAELVPPPQAAMILNGVLDLESLGDKSSMVTSYLGGPCSSQPAACKEASPTAQVHSGAPSFFVGHGTADQIVPFAQAEAFVAALRASQVPVQSFVAKDGPHTYWRSDKYFNENVTEILSFLSGALPAHKP